MGQEKNIGKAKALKGNVFPLKGYTLKYLKEEPVTVTIDGDLIDSGEVSFAHAKIAEGIVKIVESVPSPYCIGLSGAWGSGKTGIVKSVEGILKAKGLNSKAKNHRMTIPHYFDVLEHTEDAFRRQLLISLENKLAPGKFNFAKSLYQSVSYEEQTPYKHRFPSLKELRQGWKNLFKLVAYCGERLRYRTWCRSLFILIFAVVFLLLVKRQWPSDMQFPFILAAIVAALLGLSPQLFKSITILRNDEAPKSPEQLNAKFEELLKEIGCFQEENKKAPEDRLLLILDNLDRCDPHNVAEVLAALTTFVKRPGIIAVVPCDVEKIIDAMTRAPEPSSSTEQTAVPENKSQRERAAEFLRKTFNTVIHIPILSERDVREFALKCIEQSAFSKLTDPNSTYRNRLVQIFTLGFYDQPRRIKTLINNMTSRLAILHFLEGIRTKIGNLDEGELICAIAWVQVIEERWPILWCHLQDRPELTWDLLKLKDMGELNKDEWKNAKLVDENEKSALKAFVDNTRWVRIEHILPVLNLRSEVEKPLAGEIIFRRFLNTDDAVLFGRVSQEEFSARYNDYLMLASHEFKRCHSVGGIESALPAIRALLKTVDKTPVDKLPGLADLVAKQFEENESRGKISEIEDPKIVTLLASAVAEESQKIAGDLLGRLAVQHLEVLAYSDPWLVVFVKKVKDIGQAAQDAIKQGILKALKEFTDGTDEKVEKQQIAVLKQVLELFDGSKALALLVGSDAPGVHAQRLKAQPTALMEQHIDLQLLLSKVLTKEKRCKATLKILGELSKTSTSTPGPFAGNIEWIERQLRKLGKDVATEDISQIYECCQSLVTAMEKHETSPIQKLLNISVPLYEVATDDDQEWVKGQILDAIKNKTLPLSDVVSLCLESASSKNFDNASVKLAIAAAEVFSTLDLDENDTAEIHKCLFQISEKSFESEFSQVESHILGQWIEKDISAHLSTVTKIVNKEIEKNTSHQPADAFLAVFPKKMSEGALPADQFKEAWTAYANWPGSDLAKLWDVVRTVVDDNDETKQTFILNELKNEEKRTAILYSESVHETLAHRIGCCLRDNSKLVTRTNPLVQILLELVSPKALAKERSLIDIFKDAINADANQMKVAVKISERVMEHVKKEDGSQILDLLGQRGAAVKEEKELFQMMKNIAAAYAKKLGMKLPECFSEKPMSAENEVEKKDGEEDAEKGSKGPRLKAGH